VDSIDTNNTNRVWDAHPTTAHSGMTFSTQQHILITGGAGFIGCNLADRLIGTGHHVVIFDNLSRRGADRNLAWLRERHGSLFTLIQDDIRDQAAIEAATDGVQIVYHLASQTAVTTSVVDPRADFEANALGTFNVLEAARLRGTNPILIYASTNKVYGGQEQVPIVEQPTRYAYQYLPHGVDEQAPLDFHSPYGCSKGAADQYVRDYHRIYGLRTVVFRQSCIYGPRQMGVEDQGWVAWFLIALMTGQPITIYGNGKQVRDLLYINDLVDAFLLATDRIDKTQGQIYNIGGGMENTISIWWEFKPLLEDVLQRQIDDPPFAAWRPGDQPVFVADTTKAQRDFGWAPRVSVREGLRRLAVWVGEHRSFFEPMER